MAVTTSDEFVIPIEVDPVNSGKAFDDIEKAAEALGISSKKLQKLMDDLAVAISSVDNESLKVAATVTTQSKALKKMTGNVEGASSAVLVLNDSEKQLNETMMETKAITADLKEEMGGIGSALSKANQNIANAVAALNDFINVVRMLSDPQTLDRIAKLLRLISAFATFKGQFEIGRKFREAAEEVEGFSQKLQDLSKDASQNFEELVEKANSFTQALVTVRDAAKIAGGGIIALAIVRKTGIFDKQLKKDFFGLGDGFNYMFEVAVGLSLALGGLGAALRESDDAAVRFAGTLSLLASVIIGTVAFGVFALIKAVADLTRTIGQKLLAVLNEYSQLSNKAAKATASFEFVLKGFNRVVGDSVGTLDEWNEIMEQVAENSTFSMGAIRKSVNLLVAEGSRIGLTFKDTSELLQVFADIASGQGKEIEDVSQAVINALLGQAEAAKTLGIDLSATGLAHAELLEQSGMTFDQLTEGQKVVVRLSEAFKQATPFIGAAAAELETVAGAEKKLEQRVNELKVVIGENSFFTVLWIRSLQKVTELFLGLPRVIVDTLSTMADFVAVGLIILGIVAKWVFTVDAVAASYMFLNAQLSTNVKLLGFLNMQLPKLGKILGFTAVKVKNLQTLLANLVLIFGSGFKAALVSSLAALKAVLATMGAWLLSISPLILKIVGVVLVVRSLIIVIEDLIPRLHTASKIAHIFSSAFETVADAIASIIPESDKGMSVLARFSLILTNLVKIAILPLVGAIVLLIAGLRALFFVVSFEWYRDWEGGIEALKKSFQDLQGVFTEFFASYANVANLIFFGEEAYADVAGEVDNLGDSFQSMSDRLVGAGNQYTETMEEMAEVTRNLVDENRSLQLEISNKGASDAARIQNNLQNSLVELELKRQQIAAEKTWNMEIEKQLRIQEQLIKQQAALDLAAASRVKNQQKLAELARMEQETARFRAEELTSMNKLVEAQQIKNDIALEAFDREAEALMKNHKLREEELEIIQKTRDALIKKGKADLVAAKSKQEEEAQKRTESSTDIVSISQVEKMSEVLGSGVGGAIGGALGAFNPAGAFMAVANVITGAIQGLIDFGPQFLDSIANIFNSLTDLPMKLVESLNGVFNSILNFLTNFVANLGNMITGILEGAANFLTALPDVLLGLVDSLPDILNKVLESLPEIALKLMSSLVRLLPLLMVQLPIQFIKVLPKMVMAIWRMIPVVINALIDGFITGIKQAINGIFEALNLGKIFNIDMSGPMEQLEELGDTIARSTSNLFQVSDLAAQAKGLDAADRIGDAIEGATKKGVNMLQKAWEKLRELWLWIWNKILKPIVDALRAIWLWIWNNIIKPLIDGIKAVWDAVISLVQRVLTEAANGLRAVFEFLGNIWDAVIGLLRSIFEVGAQIFTKVWETLRGIFDKYVEIWKKVFSFVGEIFSKWFNFLKSVFMKAWDLVKKLFDKYIGLWKKLFETVKGIFAKAIEPFKKLFDGLKDMLQGIFDGLKMDKLKKSLTKLFDKLNPVNVLSKMFSKKGGGGKGTVEKLLGIDIPFVTFAQGGLVPGKASVPGDSEKNDKILALLSPGEFVIPRSDMQNPITKKLLAMMEGGLPQFGLGGFVKAVFSGDAGKAKEELKGTFKPSGSVRDVIDVGTKAFGDSQKALGSIAEQTKKNIVGGIDALGEVIGEVTGDLWKKYASQVVAEVRNSGHQMIAGTRGREAFATGGLVGGTGTGDTVPANLTPGEFVVTREAARPNLASLNFLNKMNSLPQAAVNNTGDTVLNVTINAKTMMTPEMVKREVVPVIEKEFRRSSMRGKFVVSTSGARTNK
jgi:phage-related protein